MNPILQAIMGIVSGPLDGLLSRFFPSKEKAQEFQNELQMLLAKQEGDIVNAAMAAQQAQIDVNKEEAKSSSLFVAGWRPAIGWVCGFALAWQFVLAPFLTWGLAVVAAETGKVLPALPVLEGSELYPILMGMLGLGSMRTFEKMKGVDRSTLKEP